MKSGSLILTQLNVSIVWFHTTSLLTSVHTVYGTEEYVGAAIKESGLSRSELFVTTKYSGLKSEDESINDSLNKVCCSTPTTESYVELLALIARSGCC